MGGRAGVEIDTRTVEELEQRLKDPLGCNDAGNWHDRQVVSDSVGGRAGVEIDTRTVEELEPLNDPLGCNHAGNWHDRHVVSDRPYPADDQLRAVLDAMPTLVWLAAPDGAAVYISQRWLEYTGLSAEQAGGWGWTLPSITTTSTV